MGASMGFLRSVSVCRIARAAVLWSALMLVGTAAAGCAALGAVAYATASMVKVKPYYLGLKGQSVAVIVSADQALRIDHPSLQLDIGRGVWNKFQQTQANKAEELV